LSLTLETASAAPVTAALPEAAPISSSSLFSRLRNPLLAVIFPGAMVIVWHLATYGQKYSLIPPPSDVALALWDLAFGGINDDAYSKTLHIHLLASLSRVYGGFAIALSVALPLGLLIGRIALIRRVLDPTLQVLRPIPVTAWLPLAMIMFGLGPRSAFFLVCLGAFYPILINTIFGVRTVDQRLFEAASMLGCQGTAQFPRGPAGKLARDLHRAATRPWLCLGGDRGGRDDRGANRPWRNYYGSAPAITHRNRHLRHGGNRRCRLHLRPHRGCPR